MMSIRHDNSSNKEKERMEEEEIGGGGLIKDGKVSGRIPGGEECFAVHYPGYPSSLARAIQTLGGAHAILQARGSNESHTSGKLELCFRPEDPYSHPISANIQASNSLLLKFSKKQSKSNQIMAARIVARIPQAFHFQGMADYQHVVPVHAEKARRKKRTWAELDQPHLEKAGLLDLDHEDVMILVPPLFSPKDIPENIALRPPYTFSSRKKQEEAAESHFEMNIEPALAIDFNIKEIPKEINWKEYTKQTSLLWQWQIAVAELFEERPIWPKGSLTERLLDKNLKFTFQTLKRLLLTVAYYFSGGPFFRFWIRKGYDPRKDPDSRIYQRLDFRLPPTLRSFCDANAATGLKHRWEDLCKFRVFPYKCQVSLQLYELDDDYIQEEIRKPPKQPTCTYGTGWFLSYVHDSFRHRVMMRFLSVYPGPGAEKLLKAASEDFIKSKRACIYKDALKPHEEQLQQTNREDKGDDVLGNESRINYADADEAESDDPEEELDAYETLDLVILFRCAFFIIIHFSLLLLSVCRLAKMVKALCILIHVSFHCTSPLSVDLNHDEFLFLGVQVICTNINLFILTILCRKILHYDDFGSYMAESRRKPGLSSSRGNLLFFNCHYRILSCLILYTPHVDIESNSRNRLQELFGSFASMDHSGDRLQDADSSGGEYEIYEQDNDEPYTDDDDD